MKTTASGSKTAQLVTIDGPSASGKTTVSRLAAERLGWDWISTGAFYRIIAYASQCENLAHDAVDQLVELIESDRWRVEPGLQQTNVFYQGKDVSTAAYAEANGQRTSQIAQWQQVRAALLPAQRAYDPRDPGVNRAGLIAEGRDCGSVVFPTADVKIYLTARSEARAQRRAEEQGLELGETQREQAQRDARDSQRRSAPLQVPEGATVIDTSQLSLEQVVERVTSVICQKP